MKVTKRRAIMATAGAVAAGGLVFGATAAFASSSPAPTATARPTPHGKWQGGPRQGHPGFGGPGGFGGFGRGGIGQGAHGEQTVKNSSGQWVDDVWQSGKVASISGGTVKITDASGTTWTWTVGSTAKVSVASKAAQLSSVKVGDTVSISGVQSGTTNNADTVLDGIASLPHGPGRPPRPNGAPGSKGSNSGSGSNSTAS